MSGLAWGRLEGALDPLHGGGFRVVEALGIDPEEYVDAVSGPLRDLSRGDSGGQPGRQAGVPEVVRPSRQGRGDLIGGQRLLASQRLQACLLCAAGATRYVAVELPGVIASDNDTVVA